MKKRHTILIVDDSEVDRNALAAVLKRRDFDVIILSDGERCAEIVNQEKPDVVLLDVLMPNVRGTLVLEQLRKTYSTLELPILMITAKSATPDVVESLSLGANDYITKPVDFDVAVMRINTHLKIASLSREMTRLKEIEAVHAMITTYNHEINNPLAIALGGMKSYEESRSEKNFIRLHSAVWKIADIVKKINGVLVAGKIEYEDYTQKTKMVRIK